MDHAGQLVGSPEPNLQTPHFPVVFPAVFPMEEAATQGKRVGSQWSVHIDRRGLVAYGSPIVGLGLEVLRHRCCHVSHPFSSGDWSAKRLGRLPVFCCEPPGR